VSVIYLLFWNLLTFVDVSARTFKTGAIDTKVSIPLHLTIPILLKSELHFLFFILFFFVVSLLSSADKIKSLFLNKAETAASGKSNFCICQHFPPYSVK
jgi:hypothetical protein